MRKFLIVAVVALGLVACNKDKTTTVTTSEGEEIKITADGANTAEDGTIPFEGKDGEGKISFGDAAVKQGLPLDLPVYPGGEVKGAFMGDGGDGTAGGMATVLTNAPPAKVIDFYKAEAEKRGFKIQSQSTVSNETGNTANFTAKAADDRSLVVTATPSDGGGTAAVIMGGGKK